MGRNRQVQVNRRRSLLERERARQCVRGNREREREIVRQCVRRERETEREMEIEKGLKDAISTLGGRYLYPYLRSPISCFLTMCTIPPIFYQVPFIILAPFPSLPIHTIYLSISFQVSREGPPKSPKCLSLYLVIVPVFQTRANLTLARNLCQEYDFFEYSGACFEFPLRIYEYQYFFSF